MHTNSVHGLTYFRPDCFFQHRKQACTSQNVEGKYEGTRREIERGKEEKSMKKRRMRKNTKLLRLRYLYTCAVQQTATPQYLISSR
jgi:hypothetical protein